MFRCNIIIVDDKQDIREPMSDFFMDIGCSVALYGEGKASLESLGWQKLAIVVVYIRLPDMTCNTFMELTCCVQPDLRYIIHDGSPQYQRKKMIRNTEAVFIMPVAYVRCFVYVLRMLSDGK